MMYHEHWNLAVFANGRYPEDVFFLNVFREDMIHIRGSQKPMTSKTWVEFQQRSKDGDSTLSASFFVTS